MYNLFMKVSFKIKKDYLISHTLLSASNDRFSSKKNRKDIVEFQNYAWKVSKDLYSVIPGRSGADILLDDGGLKKYQKMTNRLQSYFRVLSKSKEFKKIHNQTEQYRKFCANQWKKNYKRASEVIKDLTQLKLNDSFTVFITHPSLKNGRNLKANKIVWGHTEDWKNYTSVYIWHEILHSYFDKSDLNHTLIELIADNELRYRLNGTKYPPFEGHEYLLKIKKRMFPNWKKYLKSEHKDFNRFRDGLR